MTHFRFKMRYSKWIALPLFLAVTAFFQNCAPPNENSLCPQGQTCGAGGSNTQYSGSSNGPSPFDPIQDPGRDTADAGDTDTYNPLDPTLRFFKNLNTTMQVNENQAYNLDVIPTGGTPPYTYEWYFKSQRISGAAAATYSSAATNYNKEGAYYVRVRDAAGGVITSATTNLTIVDPPAGCVASRYVMLKGSDRHGTLSQFDNVRGKFLISETSPAIAALVADTSSGARSNTFYYQFQAASYMERRQMACTTYVPRINEASTATGLYLSRNSTIASYTGTITGAMVVECRNNKWKLVSNSCAAANYNKDIYFPPYDYSSGAKRSE